MARYTGPKCKLCRREGVKLFLKGTRCESEKCAVAKRRQAPGQHGTTRRRPGSYELQLREKQKAKRIYGILEKQFGNYVKKAMRQKEITGQALMQMLELRLDNVVYRAGLVASRAQARQFIRFGYFSVNGEVVFTPSYNLKAGDVVKASKEDKISSRELVKLPEWLTVDSQAKSVEVSQNPNMEQIEKVENLVNPQLIVEYYSR